MSDSEEEEYDYIKLPKRPSLELKEAMGYTVPSPLKFGFQSNLTEAKSTFTVRLLKSKRNSEVVKVEFEGTFRGERIWGKSTQVHLGIDLISSKLVRDIFLGKWRRENHRKEFPESMRRKIEKEAFEKLAASAKKVGGEVENGR